MVKRSTKSTMPSWGALLGMLAIAGYQNREKLAELLKQAKAGLDAGSGADANARIKDLAKEAGGSEPADAMTDVVKGVVDGMRKSGLGPIVESWIGTGTNKPVADSKLEHAVGADLIEELSRRTGMTKSQLLKRLATDVPRLVDDMTPHGSLPG